MSFPSSGKPKKTKLEKIAELEGKLKVVLEENRRLKGTTTTRESSRMLSSTLAEDTRNTDWFTVDDGPSSVGSNQSGGGDVEKLKEALRALKRVTVKQEMTLSTLRQKSKQRRNEIEQKDKLIKDLMAENKAFRIAHERMTSTGGDDISELRGHIADLQLQLAKAQSTKETQSRMLKESEEGINSLQTQLSILRGRGIDRKTSFSSQSIVSDTSSGEDIIRLKRELAKKTEKIVNLQHDLEVAKDEIHDMKQRYQFSASFPLTPVPGTDDFFDEDDEGEDDFWN
jgi:chromosome segregation ATPase